ncbi:MAG: hypothetical protein ACTTH5_03555 [Wolinella sp.]
MTLALLICIPAFFALLMSLFALIYLSVGYLMRSFGSDKLGTLRGCTLSMPISMLFFYARRNVSSRIPAFFGIFKQALNFTGLSRSSAFPSDSCNFYRLAF